MAGMHTEVLCMMLLGTQTVVSGGVYACLAMLLRLSMPPPWSIKMCPSDATLQQQRLDRLQLQQQQQAVTATVTAVVTAAVTAGTTATVTAVTAATVHCAAVATQHLDRGGDATAAII